MNWSGSARTRASTPHRGIAVDDLINLVGAVDGICQLQAKADAVYFARCAGRSLTDDEVAAIHATTLAAYRWQYIGSGVQDPRFVAILEPMLTPAQGARIQAAMLPIVEGTAH